MSARRPALYLSSALVLFGVYFAVEMVFGGNKSFTDFLATVWGRVVLVDLLIGLILVGCWIAYRERSIPRTFLWCLALLALGNAATLIYLLIALRQVKSHSDWQQFFHGRRD